MISIKIIYDSIFIIITSVIILSSMAFSNWAYNKYSATNEQKVFNNYVYAKLIECTDILGAYGEKVDFNIKFSEFNDKELSVCLEKIFAYGWEVDDNSTLFYFKN